MHQVDPGSKRDGRSPIADLMMCTWGTITASSRLLVLLQTERGLNIDYLTPARKILVRIPDRELAVANDDSYRHTPLNIQSGQRSSLSGEASGHVVGHELWEYPMYHEGSIDPLDVNATRDIHINNDDSRR